MVEDARIGG